MMRKIFNRIRIIFGIIIFIISVIILLLSYIISIMSLGFNITNHLLYISFLMFAISLLLIGKESENNNQKENKKDIKALKVLTELVLIDDDKMSNDLIKWYLGKIKEIYKTD